MHTRQCGTYLTLDHIFGPSSEANAVTDSIVKWGIDVCDHAPLTVIIEFELDKGRPNLAFLENLDLSVDF